MHIAHSENWYNAPYLEPTWHSQIASCVVGGVMTFSGSDRLPVGVALRYPVPGGARGVEDTCEEIEASL